MVALYIRVVSLAIICMVATTAFTMKIDKLRTVSIEHRPPKLRFKDKRRELLLKAFLECKYDQAYELMVQPTCQANLIWKACVEIYSKNC